MDQQYILTAGLKRFGGEGVHELTSELDQLHCMETFAPLNANKLTKKDREEALSSLLFLT